MRYLLLLLTLCLCSLTGSAEEAKQNRGLFAFVNGDKVHVSWRARATDVPFVTKYLLYGTSSTGKEKLIGTYNSKTMVELSKALYEKYTFEIVVTDRNDNEIDRQSGVKVKANPYIDIRLQVPYLSRTDASGKVEITYTPGDCSAYDMDGDGEQEIILKWMPSVLTTQTNSDKGLSGNEFFDCYKLDGTLLWRIDMGQNCNAGNNVAFYCWDFDGDGKGEMMVKSAPGTKDADGNYVGSAAKSATGSDLPGYPADLEKIYYRGSDGLPTKGEEWVTCFSWEGKELASRQYWPYFSIQSNWNPGGSSDGYTYGRRGCSQKGGVMTIPCNDGEVRPVSFFQRGAYTYVYGLAVSWDGEHLTEEWRHASTAASGKNCSWVERNGVRTYQDISLYAQGAHPSQCCDMDGDGYDECCIGAATIDHDGTVLWNTKLGHGDAVHVGEFDPDNEGLEMFRITEGATAYDASLHDAKTGNVLSALKYTKGDVGRGLIMDVDSAYAGKEYFCMTYGEIYNCKGEPVHTKNMGKNNGYPNYRIYWDGDLLDEHLSGNVVSKYSKANQIFERCSTPTSGTKTLWSLYQVNSINGTKENPCLQCDLFGDWREELVYYVSDANGLALRILTTTFPTTKMLPWLRDDNTYSKQVACQNVGYSMPPSLGYDPVAYYHEFSYSPADVNRDGVVDISDVNLIINVITGK